ncbi:MAG TPA: DUF4434 domain-containing protein [Streptosporangiaceae bacterium]|nr:DUF4434 domain-containing protein [Streptosporangiaceae bacterium]
MRLPIISTMAAAGVLATAALASLTLSPVAAEATTSPVMSSTFLQPSGTTIPWTAKQYQSEITLERAAGITGIIDQWTIDEDANQAYYPDASGWYPRGDDMTDPLLSAAGSAGDTVWLGLANVSAWQSHAGDASWLSNQLYVDEQTADQLYRLYGSNKAVKGWYVPFEVSDQQLGSSADAAAMKSFFTSLTTYLHSHDGDQPVMTSPTYEHLTESPAQYASSAASVLGGFDVINVQDSGGSGYEQPSDITNWFTALHKALAGTRSALWDDPDLFSASNKGGPMTPSQLQANLKAAAGLVSAYSGFSFTTQMDPNLIGTSSYYSAYQTYERKQS